MPTTRMTEVSKQSKRFEYGTARVKDFTIDTTKDLTRKTKHNMPKINVTNVSVEGQRCIPSRRFWTSIQCRFGFSNNVFRYFDHKEVFDRISEKNPNDTVRYCIEHDDAFKKSTLLAVTNPTNVTVEFSQLSNLLGSYTQNAIKYSNGIVRSEHAPRAGEHDFVIGGEKFGNRFVIDTPIDGFGRPNIYLALIRYICSNGAVGYSPAFRSEISAGKNANDMVFALIRAIEGFNNEEGFIAIRQRFEAAQKSWASISEAQKLYKALAMIAHTGAMQNVGREYQGDTVIETCAPILNKFHRVTGDIMQLYGLANVDALSQKRQRTLPVACKVYDLINFATEVATHHTNEAGNRKLQAYIGDLISNEFDLEGTCDQFTDWRDFFLDTAKTSVVNN